jgi:hypothetical protein
MEVEKMQKFYCFQKKKTSQNYQISKVRKTTKILLASVYLENAKNNKISKVRKGAKISFAFAHRKKTTKIFSAYAHRKNAKILTEFQKINNFPLIQILQ